MAVIGAFDPEEFEGLYAGPGDEERAGVLSAIRAASNSWREAEAAIILAGNVRWRPDLVTANKGLLFLSLMGGIPRALIRRMEAARESDYDLTVALGSRGIEISTLLALQELDARIIAIDWLDTEEVSIVSYRSVADWISTERISLSPDDFQRLARARLTGALSDPRSVKGRLYEEVLCLLFSQISWVTVDEHSYRNESEEIDLILGIHATGHIAELAKGPVAIATAKNESKATGSSTVKYLKEQMANRKGRCKLGFLCSASTISREAGVEILRGSQSSDLVLAHLDRDDLEALISKPTDLDEGLQRLIRRAVDA
jgi:hypothetical protein